MPPSGSFCMGGSASRRADPRARFDPHWCCDIQDTAWASALLVVYAVGAAIPMLAIAYGGQAVTGRSSQHRANLTEAAAGVWRRRHRLRGRLLLSIRHGRRSTSSIKTEKSCSSTTAKASTSRWTAPSRGCSTPPADQSRQLRRTIVTVSMISSASS